MNSIVRLICVPALITLGVTPPAARWTARTGRPGFSIAKREAEALSSESRGSCRSSEFTSRSSSRSSAARLRAGKMVLYAMAGLVAFFVIGFGGMRLLD